MRTRRGMRGGSPMETPASEESAGVVRRSDSGPQLIHQALARLLVVAPAPELRAVPDPVARDVVEPDLAHQLRAQSLPHELLVRLPAGGLARAALPGAVGLEEPEQLPLLLRLES